MVSVLVIRLRSLKLLRVSGIVVRLHMFLLLITFLKASHSFRNRLLVFFFSSRRRHTRLTCDWSSDVCSSDLGAASHLCGMLFMSAIQTDLLTVPYKGTGPAMNDLLGGQVTFMCDQTTNTTSQIKSGKVKVYGVTSAKRVPSLPEVPTLQEQGLKGFEVGIWHGLYAPKGTPKPVLDKLVAALQETVKDEAVKKRFAELGATTYPPEKATPQALQAHLKSEIDKWTPLIKKAGVYAD